MKRVLVEGRRRVYDDIFKIEEVHLRYELFDGSMSPTVRRLNFERGDSVAALLYKPDTERILLINQFKYPAYEKGPGWITETMAGMVGDEDPESAARREILEEAGYRVRNLEHISTFYASPGGSSERVILYYAEVVESDKIGSGGGLETENEDIAGIELTVTDAMEQIRTGEIVDAKTIIAIYWLKNRLIENATV
jgi:nudix-type nucleoside diphosphatase (YffH/AdpP family)